MFGLFKTTPQSLTTKATLILVGTAVLLFGLGYALKPIAKIIDNNGDCDCDRRSREIQMDILDLNDDYALDQDEDFCMEPQFQDEED